MRTIYLGFRPIWYVNGFQDLFSGFSLKPPLNLLTPEKTKAACSGFPFCASFSR